MRPVKRAVRGVLRLNRRTADLVPLYAMWKRESFLYESGWLRSYNEEIALTHDGQPLAWFTYSALSFLQKRVTDSMTVFEYGSGNSTLWWSERVARVISCEHNEIWLKQMKEKIPSNVELLYVSLTPGGNYCRTAQEYDSEIDILVIDGRDRVNCAKHALPALKGGGVIVWDNAGRERYQEGFDFLVSNGFKRIDFEGLGPVNPYAWITSIFYPDQNCLAL